MGLKPFRNLVWAVTLSAGAGCLGSEPELPSWPPFQEGDIVFRMEPRLLGYYFRDTSSTNAGQRDITLRWLTDTVYTGYNCIGFRPRSETDTIGQFFFYYFGPNEGLLEQTVSGSVDTVIGRFLTGLEGTRGNYAVNSQNQLRLFWEDAKAEARYFDPSAQLTFIGDTLRSVADLSHKADSIRAQWNVSWVRDFCTQ